MGRMEIGDDRTALHRHKSVGVGALQERTYGLASAIDRNALRKQVARIGPGVTVQAVGAADDRARNKFPGILERPQAEWPLAPIGASGTSFLANPKRLSNSVMWSPAACAGPVCSHRWRGIRRGGARRLAA